MADSIITLQRTGPVALITLNRPERRNAFNEAMWHSLSRVVSNLKASLPRAVVLAGAGNGAFCAGFDVNPDNPQVAQMIEPVQRHDRNPIEMLIRRIRGIVDELTSLPVPVIAAVNGDAYGGGAELACRCDLRIVDPAAVFCFSEVRLGLMPDWGGGAALTRLIGIASASELILTGKKVAADEALRIGLVNRISAPGTAVEEAKALACAIAAQGPRAIRYSLDMIRRSFGLPLKEALEIETDNAVSLIASGECLIGITAFLAKKEPVYPDPD